MNPSLQKQVTNNESSYSSVANKAGMWTDLVCACLPQQQHSYVGQFCCINYCVLRGRFMCIQW